MASSKLIVSGFSALSFAAGAVFGAVYVKKKCDERYEFLLDDLDALQKRYDELQLKRDDEKIDELDKGVLEEEPVEELVATPPVQETAVIPPDVQKALINYGAMSVKGEEVSRRSRRERRPSIPPALASRFSSDDAVEVSEDAIYIILPEAFGENDFVTVRLTYFSGDNVLCDDRDIPIPPDEARIRVGDTLLQFGYIEENPNVIFVRNRHLGIDYEIAKRDGRYAEEVMDIDVDEPEL